MTVASDGAPAQIMTRITNEATGMDLMTDTGGDRNSRMNLKRYEIAASIDPSVSPIKNPRVILRSE